MRRVQFNNNHHCKQLTANKQDMSFANSKEVANLIRHKFDELAKLYSDLVPFDSIYDEDLLECKYQQRDIIMNEIVCEKEGKVDVERLKAFENLLDSLDNDIEMLVTARMIEYSKWKTKYMSVCERIHKVQERINALVILERSMNEKQ